MFCKFRKKTSFLQIFRQKNEKLSLHYYGFSMIMLNFAAIINNNIWMYAENIETFRVERWNDRFQ